MDTPSTNSQNSSMNGKDVASADDKKSVRPQPDHVEKCPRCDSGNTKFCYYNNYSLTQPRYFCKACRRYWTKGGTLRNVPVGGGCRKNKRSTKRALDNHHLLLVQNQQLENNNVLMSSGSFDPNINHGGLSLADHSNFSSPLRYEDPGTCDSLSLAFATLQRQSNVMQVHHPNHNLGFGYDYKYSVMAHQEPATINGNTLRSSTTPGFQSNFFEPQTLTSFNSNYLYNYGVHAQSDQTHTKPLLLDGNQNLSNMDSAEGFNMNGNKAFLGQENNDNNELRLGGGSSHVKNNNNLAIGTNVSNNYNCNYNDVYSEVQGGGRSESWNNTGLAAASSWPSLINTAALIM